MPRTPAPKPAFVPKEIILEKVSYFVARYWTLIVLFSLFIYRSTSTSALDAFLNPIPHRTPQSSFEAWLSAVENTSFIKDIRSSSAHYFEMIFPSPHSELLKGMTLGIDDLSKVPRFKEALVTTGTIHVVVVSGFNINLIYDLLFNLLGSRYRLRNLILAILGTLFYCVVCGLTPPVLRSWIMGTVSNLYRFSGTRLDALRGLFFAALLMLVLNPFYLSDLSFQLSFFATLGLLLYGGFFEKFPKCLSDLGTTISAQVFVWPIISNSFGRISVLSFLVNPLTLWSVSLTTLLGLIFVLIGLCTGFTGVVVQRFAISLMALIIFPFVDFFCRVVSLFSDTSLGTINFTVSRGFVYMYILFFFFLGVFMMKKTKAV